MDLERLLLDNLPLIDRIVASICRRNRLTKEESEDFASVVRVKLIANGYEVLRAFSGKSSLGGYLVTVIQHAYRDHRNHLWGKWRPSAKAIELGPLAIRLDTMLHRDRMTLDEACAAAPPEDREEMRRLAPLLPPHTKRHIEDVEQLEDLPSAAPSPEAQLLDRERCEAAARLQQVLAEALRDLSDEDRSLVQLRFERGVKIASLARAYGVDARQLYRRWELLAKKLRKTLEGNGYDATQVAWALEGSEAGRQRRTTARPSSLRG
jgi:RNA polymerase sigma factor for flagellar operon FliA